MLAGGGYGLGPTDQLAVDSNGNTPLHYAAAVGRQNAVAALMDAPTADHSSLLLRRNNAGLLPLHYAALRGHWKTMEILLEANIEYGAAFNAEDVLRQSVLFVS
jgi:ankyrin repeat protein